MVPSIALVLLPDHCRGFGPARDRDDPDHRPVGERVAGKHSAALLDALLVDLSIVVGHLAVVAFAVTLEQVNQLEVVSDEGFHGGGRDEDLAERETSPDGRRGELWNRS